MRSYYVHMLMSSSIILPAILAIARFRHVQKTYYLFFILVFLRFLHEVMAEILAFTIRNNMYVYNISVLLEGLIIVYLFRSWNLFTGNNRFFRAYVVFFIAFWTIFYLGFGLLKTFYSQFLVFENFSVVFICITFLNKMISDPATDIKKNPKFIIAIALLINNTLNCFINVFWIFDYHLVANFGNLSTVVVSANLVSYILFAYAILLMPAKPQFLLEKNKGGLNNMQLYAGK